MTGNVVGFETTMDRDFCASCHVMEPWTDDSMDPTSQTLAARHSRNKWFGAKNCYTCHSDYEMFGMVTTKLTGMLHVYHYYLSYLDVSQEEAKKKIELYAPFKNLACMQCHSTEAKIWNEQIDHKGARDDVRTEKVSCVSRGCHGPAHPFSKLARGEVLDAPPSGGPIERVETATPTGEVSP
jgi:cytochrome c-type protein NapC